MSIFSSTEHEFRRVEAALIHAARNPGTASSYPTPVGITTKTFANRIRTGARFWLFHKFPSPLFDLQFADIWPTLVVREYPNGVSICPRGSRNGGGTIAPPSSGGIVQVVAEDPSDDDVAALLHLHHRGLLTEATHFPNLQVADAETIQERITSQRLNAAIAPHPVSGYILL